MGNTGKQKGLLTMPMWRRLEAGGYERLFFCCRNPGDERELRRARIAEMLEARKQQASITGKESGLVQGSER